MLWQKHRVLVACMVVIFAVPTAVLFILAVGALASLDRDRVHTGETAGLETFAADRNRGDAVVLSLVDTGEFVFRARAAGFGGTRGNVILLHGFPESSAMYEPMIPELARAGYQVIAYDQRGYSPGARPLDRAAYETHKLVADVFAVADAVGFDRFHLVGHDWGAGIGWALIFEDAARVESWSALSIPHMGAYTEAIAADADQQQRSAYLAFFRLPWLPEAVFSFNDFAMMRNNIYAEHSLEIVAEYVGIFAEPGALTAALNWYRAAGALRPGGLRQVHTPTAFIWGQDDPVVGQRALELQRGYFDGNLWETPLDTGHWLMETEPEAVTSAVLAHLDRVSGHQH